MFAAGDAAVATDQVLSHRPRGWGAAGDPTRECNPGLLALLGRQAAAEPYRRPALPIVPQLRATSSTVSTPAHAKTQNAGWCVEFWVPG